MRHQAHDVTFTITDSRDVVTRTVGIRGIGDGSIFLTVTKDNAILPL